MSIESPNQPFASFLADPEEFLKASSSIGINRNLDADHSTEVICLARVIAAFGRATAVENRHLAAAAVLQQQLQGLNFQSGYPEFDRNRNLLWRGQSYKLLRDDLYLLRLFVRNKTTFTPPDAIRNAVNDPCLSIDGIYKKVQRLKKRLRRRGFTELADAIRPAGRLTEAGSYFMDRPEPKCPRTRPEPAVEYPNHAKGTELP